MTVGDSGTNGIGDGVSVEETSWGALKFVSKMYSEGRVGVTRDG